MLFKDTKILEFNQYWKSVKTSSILTIWSWIFNLKKKDAYNDNPEKSSTTKVGEHIPVGMQCLK